MVIGNGLVAKAFESYIKNDSFLIFASGVSNSKSSSGHDYDRERFLLEKQIKEHSDKTLVYFSTSSIEDPDLKGTPYIEHKLHMEAFIKKNSSSYFIFRLSNLAGFTNNPNTILNFFYHHIFNSWPFVAWENSERNIIDVADVFAITHHILQQNIYLNEITNIANTINYPVPYIIETIEKFCGKKALCTKISKGEKFIIDVSKIETVCNHLHIDFGKDYLPQVLKKYYPANEI
jgi:nucleoside-diphosphate-sugar epimerase